MTALPVLRGSAAESFAYWGEHEGWLIALSQTRDSETVERSNWYIITDDMQTRFPDDTFIESMSHWAVGWVEYLIVRPDTDAAKAAVEWAERLAAYPVADDEHHSMLEFDEQWCVRCDHGIRSQHPGDGFVCRKFRSDEDAQEIKWRWHTRRNK